MTFGRVRFDYAHPLRIDPDLERKQIARVQAARDARDAAAVHSALATLKEAARVPERNLMGQLVECALARASEGEIVECLQQVFD